MDEYINKAALVEIFRAKAEMGRASGYGVCFDAAAKMVEMLPTADVVQVRHGGWAPVPSSDMVTGKAYKCSECKRMRYGSFKPNYCANCGAKMDGKDNENG